MTEQAQIKLIEKYFPVLSKLEQPQREIIYSAGQYVELPAGQMLMQQNQQCLYLPFVIKGCLRVFSLAANGREMTLFRSGPGDTCLLSIACQMKNQDFPALAEVETAAGLFMLPMPVYHQSLADLPAWKDYLITMLYSHLAQAVETIETVAFSRTDKRLATWLLEHMQAPDQIIKATHEAIAVELGTAREVVSRLLGDLKNKQIVALARGRITVLDPVLLQQLSQQD